MSADRVYFVYKHDTRHIFLCLFKQRAHSACADADEHFHKITARYGEKRHTRFSRNRFGKQGFARSRRAHKQNAGGNSRPKLGIFARIFQKIDDFYQLFLFLLGARNIGKTGFYALLHTRRVFAEAHALTVLTAENVYHKYEHNHNQYNGEQRGQIVPKTRLHGIVEADLNRRRARRQTVVALRYQFINNGVHIRSDIEEIVVILCRIVAGSCFGVSFYHVYRVARVEINRLNIAGVKVLLELRVGGLLAVAHELQNENHCEHKHKQNYQYHPPARFSVVLIQFYAPFFETEKFYAFSMRIFPYI